MGMFTHGERKFSETDQDFPTTKAARALLDQHGRMKPRLVVSALPPTARQPEVPVMSKAADAPVAAPIARPFTNADKALIRKLHELFTINKLLDLLNDRLVADLGQNVVRHTLKDLRAEIAGMANPKSALSATDWPSLRKLLAEARRAGTLAKVSEQVINDFAIVFALAPKQVVSLKDILLSGSEDQS